MSSYGLPTGTNLTYGSPGFPDWVYQLAARFNVRASTYPGHQETDRVEAGYARNPAHLNRGIDWAGSVPDMQRLANYLFSVKGELEQLIWENTQTGRRLGVAGGKDVTTTAYYAYPGGYDDHRDHVHTRQDHPVPLPGNETQESALTVTDPFTGAMWCSNRYHPRGAGTPRWIAVHTQEGGRTAVGLAQFLIDSTNTSNPVSYHVVNDDHDALKVVAEDDAPYAAAGANKLAFHICLAGSYSAWSRGKWLETDTSDGKNEDLELTIAAKVIAWWCQKYSIPAEYIGGRGVIPWGSDGICGHADFGSWGGGHHDPGNNFPWDELIRRVKAFLGGNAPTPLPAPVPVGPGGGAPVNPATSQYFTGLLYKGSAGPQVSELQRTLGGGLPVDGDFGSLTDAAVRAFQRSKGLTVDGIVGPQTAAALKLRKV